MKKILLFFGLLLALNVSAQTIPITTLIDTTKANGQRIVVKWNGNGLWQIEDSTADYISVNNSGLLCQVYVTIYASNDTIPATGYMKEGVWIPMSSIRSRFDSYYSSASMRNSVRRELKYITKRRLSEFIRR